MPEVLAYRGIDPVIIAEPYHLPSVQRKSGRFATKGVNNNNELLGNAIISRGSLEYNPLSVVNMPYNGVGNKNSNSQGWLVNRQEFAEQLYKQNPKAFSIQNIIRKKQGKSLVVDEEMVQAFPQYHGFEGEKLIHHHIGGDGQAVGIPARLHIGYGGIHNAEEERGIRSQAEQFSKFYANCIKENPKMSREEIENSYLNVNRHSIGDVTEYSDNSLQSPEFENDKYSNGASYLISKENYDRFVEGNHGEFLGRDGNLFVVPNDEMDKILSLCSNNPRALEYRLGLKSGSLGNGDFVRVDIPNALDYPIEMPNSNTPGTNENFIEGGKTSGDVSEAVIKNVPTFQNDSNAINSTLIHPYGYNNDINKDTPKNQNGTQPEESGEPSDEDVLGQNGEDTPKNQNGTQPEESGEPSDEDVLGQNGEDTPENQNGINNPDNSSPISSESSPSKDEGIDM